MYDHSVIHSSDKDRGAGPVSENTEQHSQSERAADRGIKDFNVKKTFGISVLLKLTQKSQRGIKILESNGRYRSNLNLEQMNRAVSMALKAHNINLKVN